MSTTPLEAALVIAGCHSLVEVLRGARSDCCPTRGPLRSLHHLTPPD